MPVLETIAAIAGIVSAFASLKKILHAFKQKRRNRLPWSQRISSPTSLPPELAGSNELNQSLVEGALQVQREYDGRFARMGRRFAAGDEVSENQFMSIIISLQQITIYLLQYSRDDQARIGPINLFSFLPATNRSSRNAIQILSDQFQRMTAEAPIPRHLLTRETRYTHRWVTQENRSGDLDLSHQSDYTNQLDRIIELPFSNEPPPPPYPRHISEESGGNRWVPDPRRRNCLESSRRFAVDHMQTEFAEPNSEELHNFDELSNEEERSFTMLWSVFPTRSPSIVRQTLEDCRGDMDEAWLRLASRPSTREQRQGRRIVTEPESPSPQHSVEIPPSSPQTQDEFRSFATLCSIFPNQPSPTIRRVLNECHGDTNEASLRLA